MTLQAVQCEACGGAVAFAAGAPEPKCLFCGSAGLVPARIPEGVEAPVGYLPFQLDEEAARARFRTFASSSIWYPGDLRHARLKLAALLLPAWTWSAHVETHWAGLVSAHTRSGKRPIAGVDSIDLEGVLIPSSQALSPRELAAISPYEPGELRPAGESDLPYEMGSLTRTAARAAAIEGMERMHAARIQSEHDTSRLRTSVVVEEPGGKPLLLPVWVGAYRRGDAVYRVVINGQTGTLTGRAPISYLRVAAAVFLLSALVVGCAGVAALLGWAGTLR